MILKLNQGNQGFPLIYKILTGESFFLQKCMAMYNVLLQLKAVVTSVANYMYINNIVKLRYTSQAEWSRVLCLILMLGADSFLHFR